MDGHFLCFLLIAAKHFLKVKATSPDSDKEEKLLDLLITKTCKWATLHLVLLDCGMKNHTDKRVGVWLDHARAYFIDFSTGSAHIETIDSNKESQVRIEGEDGSGTQLGNHLSTNSEHHEHNREQAIQQEYHTLIRKRLIGYDDIFIFGSGTAKDELFNHLRADKHFNDKTINVQPADQMTENQKVAEVKKFFNL